jgi:hypothetical protein
VKSPGSSVTGGRVSNRSTLDEGRVDLGGDAHARASPVPGGVEVAAGGGRAERAGRPGAGKRLRRTVAAAIRGNLRPARTTVSRPGPVGWSLELVAHQTAVFEWLPAQSEVLVTVLFGVPPVERTRQPAWAGNLGARVPARPQVMLGAWLTQPVRGLRQLAAQHERCALLHIAHPTGRIVATRRLYRYFVVKSKFCV